MDLLLTSGATSLERIQKHQSHLSSLKLTLVFLQHLKRRNRSLSLLLLNPSLRNLKRLRKKRPLRLKLKHLSLKKKLKRNQSQKRRRRSLRKNLNQSLNLSLNPKRSLQKKKIFLLASLNQKHQSLLLLLQLQLLLPLLLLHLHPLQKRHLHLLRLLHLLHLRLLPHLPYHKAHQSLIARLLSLTGSRRLRLKVESAAHSKKKSLM